MAITVEYDTFTDFAEKTNYGKDILELPEKIQNAINDYTDGGQYTVSSADDLVINSLSEQTKNEVIDTLKDGGVTIPQDEDFDLAEFIAENEDEVREAYESQDFYYLGSSHGKVWLLQ